MTLTVTFDLTWPTGNQKARKQNNRIEQWGTHPRHVLLADEALYVPLRELLPDQLREGRVLHVGVEGHHAGVGLRKLEQGVAVGLPRKRKGERSLFQQRRAAGRAAIHMDWKSFLEANSSQS